MDTEQLLLIIEAVEATGAEAKSVIVYYLLLVWVPFYICWLFGIMVFACLIRKLMSMVANQTVAHSLGQSFGVPTNWEGNPRWTLEAITRACQILRKYKDET